MRAKGFVVTLEYDLRDEDVDATLTALRLIRGVASVDVLGQDPHDWVNRQRIRLELENKIYEALREKPAT